MSGFGGFSVNSVEFALTPGEYEGLAWHYWECPLTIEALDADGNVLSSVTCNVDGNCDETGNMPVSGASSIKLTFSCPDPVDYDLFHFRLIDFWETRCAVDNVYFDIALPELFPILNEDGTITTRA